MNERKANWHRLTGEETVRQLHSNASYGLSRKEARSRFRKMGANTLFDPPQAVSRLVKRILTDPLLLLTVSVCILAICFFDPTLGIATMLPILVCLAISLRSAFRIQRRQTALLRREIPRVRVIRQGVVVSVSARSVVPGDVLLLRSGDIVPADCRILSGDRLRVRFSYRKVDGERAAMDSVKNAERIYAYGEEIHAPAFENLVYAGSEILSGSARVIVLEIGAHSFLGAMGTPFERRGEIERTPRILASIYPYLRLFSFAMLALALPISVVGLLISPKEFSAWRVFLPICAFVASASATLPSLCFEWIFHRGAEDGTRDLSIGFLPKTARAFDAIPKMDELILLGRAATSDGLRHFDRAFFGGVELKADEGNEAPLQSLCEAFLLLATAEEALPISEHSAWEGHQPFLSELTHASAFDVGALEVRLLRSALSEQERERILDVQTKQESFRLRFLRGEDCLSACAQYISQSGALRSMTPQIRASLVRFLADARQRAASVTSVLREQNGEVALLGCLALRERFLPQIPELFEKLERNGTRVRIFLERDTPHALVYPHSCGCAEEPICASDGISISSAEQDRHFFVGYSKKEIFEEIRMLRKSGKTVVVMGNTSGDLGVLSAASVRVGCDCSLSTKNGIAGFEAGVPEETAKALHSVQTVCREADLLIPSASAIGGGLASLLAAKRRLAQDFWRVRLFLRRYASLQIFRAVLFLAVLLSGLGSIPPFVFFYTAWVPDLIALLLALFSSPTEEQLSVSCHLDAQEIRRILTDRGLWLVSSVSALSLFLPITVLRIAGLIPYAVALPLVAAASILMQAVLLLFSGESGVRLPSWRRMIGIFALLILPMLAAILLSVLFPPVSRILELGAWNASSLILLGISPLLAIVCSLLLSRFS